jgi:hypothetical protein
MLRLLAIALLVCSALSGRASAQEPQLSLEGELPFNAAELRAAVQPRRTTWEALQGRSVSIRGSGSTLVLELGERRRSLDLGGARGADAARLVALSLADLALAEPAAAAVQARAQPTAANASASPPSRAPATVTAVDGSASNAHVWTRVALIPSVGKGFSALDPWTHAVELGVSQAIEPWLIEADIAWWAAPQIHRNGFASGWDAARLRLQAGLRLGVLELLAGPALAPLWVSGGDGHQGVLFAAGVTARVALRIHRHIDGLLALGLDLFPHRVELQAYDVSVIATPRAALFAGVGLGWRSS